MGRAGRVALAIVGILVIAAAIVYVAVPDGHVSNAGEVVGYTPPPDLIRALWIGDSYTAGTGASSTASAESCLTSAALGWTCGLDAEGGTGYVADGHGNDASFGPLGSRLTSDRTEYSGSNAPQIVIVDAGRNDGASPAAAVRAAAGTYLTRLRAAFPRARLVLIAPYFMTSGAPVGPLANFYRTARIARLHPVVIDPIREGWISPTRSGRLTGSDKIHPSPAGHRYIATHLASDMRKAGLPVQDAR